MPSRLHRRVAPVHGHHVAGHAAVGGALLGFGTLLDGKPRGVPALPGLEEVEGARKQVAVEQQVQGQLQAADCEKAERI